VLHEAVAVLFDVDIVVDVDIAVAAAAHLRDEPSGLVHHGRPRPLRGAHR
jgi:hypothetical protein